MLKYSTLKSDLVNHSNFKRLFCFPYRKMIYFPDLFSFLADSFFSDSFVFFIVFGN